MAKIYISSTYSDLKNERETAAKAVRRLKHQSICMEDYAAADQRPVDKCLQDVKNCDAYVGIFAWRYGFIPDGCDKSITHLEYENAKKAGIPCLIFLLDEPTPGPDHYVSTGEDRGKIDQLRNKLKNEHTVSFFKNADELSTLVTAAVGNLIFMAERSFIKFKPPEKLIGTQLGKYVIREKLGKGGKGVVFKVMDTLEEREKAIKMVPPRIADSPVAFKELKQEVNTAACIIHPHVVKVLGLEEFEGQFFILMEYIEGKSLEQILADSKEGKLEESQVIDIMKKMALGLVETHKKHVIHRDIKPSNVMVTPDGQVKILDFGISYQVTTSMTELVGEHHRTGTWPYMAPEQLTTRYGRETKQVDIWGFGVTMYQLLTGKFPFMNKDQIKDRNEKPYELAGVSRKTRNIVIKCLEKDRKKRFQNMEEVLEALNSISKRKGKTKPISKPEQKPKKSTLLKWSLAAASIIVLVVLSVFLIVWLMQGDKTSQVKPVEVKTDVLEETHEQIKETGVDPKEKSEEEFKKSLDQAVKHLKNGDIEAAREELELAKKIEETEETQSLEKQIKELEIKQKELKKQDDLAYVKAFAQNTIDGYQAYLDKYPDGGHVSEAKIKINELKEMPEDVRKVAARASKGIKVYETKKDLWEADYGDGIIMVYIPVGTFTMGSNDYDNDDKPTHEVYLDGYWMGKTEVTVVQYKAFISDTGREPLSAEVSKYSPGNNHPVVYVSWEDADAYCKWLSKKIGLTFKLPTEAQWEKAARGTDQRKYPWGDHNPYYNGKWYANYASHDSLEKRGEDGFEFTSPVGYYQDGASPYGLLDMAGNVWEWCRDWYAFYYYKNSLKTNPTGPESGPYRVMRGGSWGSGAWALRCADRGGYRPSYRGDIGFRLCQDN